MIDQQFKSEGFSYNGKPWFLVIEKTTFTAGIEYFYSIIVCAHEEPISIDLMQHFFWGKNSHFKVTDGCGFKTNVYAQIKDFAQGMAEALFDIILEKQESDIVTLSIDETKKKRGKWLPRTKPTQLQKINMKVITEAVIKTIGVARLARYLDVSELTVRNWQNRGMIAGWVCDEICRIPAIKRMGYKKETLRPDIEIWKLETID